MTKLRQVFLVYLLPALAVAMVAGVYAAATDAPKQYLCESVYALCDGARCIPDPGDTSKTICYCEVEQGPNMATVPCEQVAPKKGKHGVQIVYSTYALEKSKIGFKGMTCPAGTPWSNCLNAICTVDPTDASRAICSCPIIWSKEEWSTMSGNCNTGTCPTGFWSGATTDSAVANNKFLTAALKLPGDLVKSCP